jgi:hypothetical protein
MNPSGAYGDRRAYPRFDATLVVGFHHKEMLGEHRAVATNVSQRGMFVRSRTVPAVDCVLTISVHFRNVTIRMMGVVAWNDPDEGFGVEIVSWPCAWLDFVLGVPRREGGNP